MSTKFILSLLLGVVLSLNIAQAQQWTRIIDAPPFPLPFPVGTPLSGTAIQATSDGGTVMLGMEEQPTGAPRYLPILSKVNAQGFIEWQRRYFLNMQYYKSFNDAAILVGNGDSILLAALEQDSGLWVSNISPLGDTLWKKTFLQNCNCSLDKVSLHPLPNGHYFIVVANTPLGGMNPNTILLELNASGVPVQQSVLLGFWAEDAQPTFDGGYILSGRDYNTNNPALQKINAQWAVEWTQSFPGIPTENYHSVAQATDSGYVVVTELQGFIGLTPRLFKVDATGQNIEWELDTLVSTVDIGLLGNSYHILRTASGSFMYVVDVDDRRPVMPVYTFKTVVAEISPTGEILDYILPETRWGVATNGRQICATGSQEFVLVGSYTNSRGYLVKLGQVSPAPHQLSGQFYVDGNSNCQLDVSERKLSNWILRAENLQTGQLYYANTDWAGRYQLQLPAGQYELAGALPNGVWTACATNITLSASSGGQDTINFGFVTSYSCPQLTVDVSTSYLAACDTVVYEVNYCNNGSDWARQPVVTLQIDTLMNWLGATVATTPLPTTGQYEARLPDLAVGQCGSFSFTVGVACQFPVGKWLCVQADIEPDTLCGQQFLGWDGSSIQVSGQCNTDSIIYWLHNVGNGAMSAARNYLVTEDHIMLRTGNYQLGAGDSVRIAIPIRNGASYYIQAEQDPMHPYSAYASGGVTDCSPSGLSTTNNAAFAQYPEDDAAPTRSIDCQATIGNDSSSYKRVEPMGFGALRLIERGVDLEYQLRFQNTTGHALNQVILVDTLSPHLDPSTLVMGASSHPYTWSLSGTGVLTIEMSLYLPDSAWGFVKFELAQQPALPLGTVIYNTAAVSFGGFLLEGTNTTFHTIDEDFISTHILPIPSQFLQWKVYPNPFSQQVTFELEEGVVPAFEVQIYDALGRVVGQVQSPTGEPVEWNAQQLPKGVYVYQIVVEGVLMGTGKLVAAP